jgi:hypothetical protein
LLALYLLLASNVTLKPVTTQLAGADVMDLAWSLSAYSLFCAGAMLLLVNALLFMSMRSEVRCNHLHFFSLEASSSLTRDNPSGISM